MRDMVELHINGKKWRHFSDFELTLGLDSGLVLPESFGDTVPASMPWEEPGPFRLRTRPAAG